MAGQFIEFQPAALIATGRLPFVISFDSNMDEKSHCLPDFLECRRTVRGKEYFGSKYSVTSTGKAFINWATQTWDSNTLLKRDTSVESYFSFAN
jgi:hypothetical protein